MYGDAVIFVEDLDRRRTYAGFDLFAPEFKWNTVIVAFDLNVIVNVLCSREHKTFYVANAVMWRRVVLLSL
jgi:hypothetical protein